MNVWHIMPDSNIYRSFTALNLSPEEHIVATDIFRRGWPLGAAWTPMRIAFYEGEGEAEKPVGDFPSFIPLAISSKALDTLHPLIKDNVEVLDLISDVGKFCALNVFVYDCLDHSSSVFKRFTDGGIMRVETYAFRAGCLEGKHIFRLPEIWTYTFASNEFKRVVEENDLKGLLFYKVPMSDESVE